MRQKLIETYPVIAEKLNAITNQNIRNQVADMAKSQAV